MRTRFLAGMIYLLSGMIGVAAFAYPFLDLEGAAAAQDSASSLLSTPLLTSVVLVLCLLALLIELQGEATSAKVVAALGMLVSAASVLRFVETAIPGPGGFSPIFAPVILAGYVFGARFGFLMGSFTLLVSALITGGIGPWFPYQMFVAGWVGFSAGLLPHPAHPRLELLLLLVVGVVWGLLFGFITNLYFWPFFTGEVGQSLEAGVGMMANVRHYLAFYATTSLLWDMARAVGNVLLLLVLGMPTVRALSRFRDRFQFTVAPGVDLRQEPAAAGSSRADVVKGTP